MLDAIGRKRADGVVAREVAELAGP